MDEDGNPIESNGENLIYVDDSGREIASERAMRMLESGDYIDTRVLYEDKTKKKAFNHMAGEARVRDQIRDEIVAKAYQMALIKDPNSLARNRAEEQAFLKINKPKQQDDYGFNSAPPPLSSSSMGHHQQQQPPPQHRINPSHQSSSSQQRLSSQPRQRALADEQARHRADEQARLKAQAQMRARAEAAEKARAEQANAFSRNRSRSTERSLHQQLPPQHQQQAQMRSRNATPITPMRLERSASRGSNHRGKENLLQQQQLQQHSNK